MHQAELIAQLLTEKFAATDYAFQVVPGGRKYVKIAKGLKNEDGTISLSSVALFVEASTGWIYKAAGWKAPAPKPRYTPTTEQELRDIIATKADLHGGWLYAR